LPRTIYEPYFDSTGQCVFKSVNFTLHSEEAEAIGIKHVSVNKFTDNKNANVSLMHDHLQPQQQAVIMLRSRIEFLIKYIDDIQSGELSINYRFLRDLNAIVSSLPLQKNKEFYNKLYSDSNEICLTSLLCAMAQSLHTLQSLLNKQNCVERDAMRKIPSLRWDNIY